MGVIVVTMAVITLAKPLKQPKGMPVREGFEAAMDVPDLGEEQV